MKRVLVSVINDLATDQRVDRSCKTLARLGFSVMLVGRKKNDSQPLPDRLYQTKRMRLFFSKGPLFYAEFNVRLFLFLLFRKADLLVSNDLDTLLPNFLIHKFRKTPLIYDSHEYFTGVPELEHRPLVRKVWKRIERWIFPKLGDIITVNESIAGLYQKEYGKSLTVVRNIPEHVTANEHPSRQELGLPVDKKIILLQGAGINIHRGGEEAVEAMQYIDHAVLLVIGSGDVIGVLRQMVRQMRLDEKVFFYPKMPFTKLLQYTRHADIGLTLDKDTSLNYRYSLPNKLFDYIYAGVPVLASPLVEVKRIVDGYNIGELIENHDPRHIASRIGAMLDNQERYAMWKENLKAAAQDLSWEREEKKLVNVYQKYT